MPRIDVVVETLHEDPNVFLLQMTAVDEKVFDVPFKPVSPVTNENDQPLGGHALIQDYQGAVIIWPTLEIMLKKGLSLREAHWSWTQGASGRPRRRKTILVFAKKHDHPPQGIPAEWMPTLQGPFNRLHRVYTNPRVNGMEMERMDVVVVTNSIQLRPKTARKYLRYDQETYKYTLTE